MVRRALTLSFTAPFVSRTREASSGTLDTNPPKKRTLDAHAVFMADPQSDRQNAHRRLSRQPSATNSRWRRPSFSSRPKDPDNFDAAQQQHPPPPAPAPAPAPVSTSNSTNTTTTTATTSTSTSTTTTPSALLPAPDSRKEIRKLLRERDDDTATASDKDSECSRPMKALEDQAARRQLRAASAIDLRAPSSLVPESLPVQPIQDIPDAAQFRAKYNLYNPVGPRWYKNHHLIPPHTRIPLSSTFSPVFPPTRTAIGGVGLAVDAGRMPGLSRTPSGSPLPTPSASQTRLGEGFPPQKRTRKLSNTAHDNVDLLDGTDPWGTNWHHQSPYDVGGLNGPPPQEPPRTNGSRTSSTTRQNGRLANPSPLSQSTSAVHLAEPPHATVPPRKRTLSKPAAGIRRFFSGSTDDVVKDVKASSAPVTPTEGEVYESTTVRRKLSKRERTAPPVLTADVMSNVPGSTDRREKRSSIMGRIGKKFSVLRKPLSEHHSFLERRGEDNQNNERTRQRRPSLSSSIREGTVAVSIPRKLSKRIPPERRELPIARRTSASIDIDFSLTMGNLTIANPDQPSSGTVSPMRANGFTSSPQSSIAPLPPPKHSPPLPLETETDDEDPRRRSVLRVRNTPNPPPEEMPEQETDKSPVTPETTYPPLPQPPLAQNPLPPPPEPESQLSPLLPPPPLGATFSHHNFPSIPSFFSPAPVSISLSTADFSSPPPLPEKTFVDPATLCFDSPASTEKEVDFDQLPDIATEPDWERERRAEVTPAPAVPALPTTAAAAPAAPSASRLPSGLRTSLIPFPRDEDVHPEPHTHTSPTPRASKPKDKSKEKGKEAEHDEDSPLSRASLYVNPPTPMAHPSTMPAVVGARAVPVRELERENAREREREREREKAYEREKEERIREWEREKEREREREQREREQREREREREREKEREREREKEREREREKERLREQRERDVARERERERERERDREKEVEREREREREREIEKEKERATRAARRESRREEKRRDERDVEKDRSARQEERSSRYEERPRGDERTSHYEERSKAIERPRADNERTSRYEDRTRHEEKDRSSRHSKREIVEAKDRDRERGSRKDRKERTSTTEEFHLVRSPSDNMRYSQGAAPATVTGQEQWTIVEAPSKRDKEKDRSSRRDKDRDREREREREKGRDKESPEKSARRRESKRDEKYESARGSSRTHHRHSSTKDESKRASVTISRLMPDGTLRHQRSQSLDDRQLNGDADKSEKDKDRRSSRRRDSRLANGHSSDSRSSLNAENALANGNVNSGASGARVERHGSLRRAVSDVPAGAEQMMHLTAGEAWDADRMWKGKSMYDPGGGAGNIHGVGSNYDPRNSIYSGHSATGAVGNPHAAAVGSTFVVQSPFYDPSHVSLAHQRSFYAIPVNIAHHPSPPAVAGPQAVVYSPQATFSPGRYDYPNAYRSYPETLDMNSPPILANPLPDPPKQSTYSPEPLVLDHAHEDPALTPEYWSVYAGITTH